MNNHKGININIGGKECRKKHESDFNKHIENTIFKMENSSNKPPIDKGNNNFGGGKDCSHTTPIEKDLINYFKWIIKKIDKGDTKEEIIRLVLMKRKDIEHISSSIDNTPTIQEDLWKQFAKEYSQLHSLDLEQVRYWFIPLIEFGKQNYTLIKK